jgi:hypothetical protein
MKKNLPQDGSIYIGDRDARLSSQGLNPDVLEALRHGKSYPDTNFEGRPQAAF